jgi:hypothetical protein
MGASLAVALLIGAATFVVIRIRAVRAEVHQLERDVFSDRPRKASEQSASLKKLNDSLRRYPEPQDASEALHENSF